MKISFVNMIIGLAVGASSVAQANPQTDPEIPREELKKIVADAMAGFNHGRSVRADRAMPAGAMPAGRMEYVGGKSHEFDVPPRFISGEAPAYPIQQRMKGQPGVAVIGFTIDEHGNTKDFVIIGTTYHFFATHSIRLFNIGNSSPRKRTGNP